MSPDSEQHAKEGPGRIARARERLRDRFLAEIEGRARGARARPDSGNPGEEASGGKPRTRPWMGSAVTGAVVLGSSVVFGFFETALGAAAAYGAYKAQKLGGNDDNKSQG